MLFLTTLTLTTALFGPARWRPSATALREARKNFNQKLDGESDAALAPLIVEGRQAAAAMPRSRRSTEALSARDASPLDEERSAWDALLNPPPKRQRARGFEWHDPRRRNGPPPPTFAERLDAEAEAALAAALVEDTAPSARATPSKPRPRQWRSAPERAVGWLQRKYAEVYEEEEAPAPERGST